MTTMKMSFSHVDWGAQGDAEPLLGCVYLAHSLGCSLNVRFLDYFVCIFEAFIFDDASSGLGSVVEKETLGSQFSFLAYSGMYNLVLLIGLLEGTMGA